MTIIPEELAIHEPDDELLEIINDKEFDDTILCEVQSDFHNIKVVENEIGRFIHYKDTYQAGFIDTPAYKGNLPYINYFTIPSIINPDIQNILLIGFGTGKLVNDYEKLFQKLNTIDIVDIEENILNLAQDFFDFKKSKKMNFYLQDGLVFLRNTKKNYDLIVVDVASDDGIDERFVSAEYLKLISSRLSKNGIFVSNLCASPDFEHPQNIFINHIKELYTNTFKHTMIFKGNTSDRVYYKSFFNIDKRVIDITNVIILASGNKLIIDKPNYINEKLNLDISPYLRDLTFDLLN